MSSITGSQTTLCFLPANVPSRPSSPLQSTMSHTYEFNISMSCGGCSGAVDRALKKLDGEFFPTA